MPRNILLCHVVDNDLREVGTAKARTHHQEFNWNKRTFPIDQKAKDVMWTDKKGIRHLLIAVNESDGTYHFLTPSKQNLIDEQAKAIDKCGQCGDRISIDAQNVRDLVKRKTINAIWGVDNSYVMLLLIMGIVLVMLVGALMFVVGELNKTNTTLQKYLPQTPKALIGVMTLQ